MKFCNNDTVSLGSLALICLCAAAVGALGGYIGSRIQEDSKNK